MENCGCDSDVAHLERRTLRMLLFINGTLFVCEAAVGWIAQSTGLLADSLDMLADAIVYGTGLYAVGRSDRLKLKAAFASGLVQISLGAGVAVEVVRRLLIGSDPASALMLLMGCGALSANIFCLRLLAKHRNNGIHMRASWIFSTNDVLANVGVIFSAAAVWAFKSQIPDLAIGGIISIVVIHGGYRILWQTRKGKISA